MRAILLLFICQSMAERELCVFVLPVTSHRFCQIFDMGVKPIPFLKILAYPVYFQWFHMDVGRSLWPALDVKRRTNARL